MRISWLSNAAWANTGYGNQTRLFAPRIQGLGHDVQITAFYGLEGGVLNWGGPNGPISVYPRGYHPYGLDVMSAHAQHFNADLMISLIDAWVIEPQMILGGLRWAPWFPVDHEQIPEGVLRRVQTAWSRIVYSRHAERLVKAAGLDCYYVPHGVDTTAFRPVDRLEVREKLKWPKDKFIAGMVAANKGNPSRKAFPENLLAFAELKKKHSDVMLYLHTVPGLENGGVDLIKLCDTLGLTTGFIGRCEASDVDVLFNDQYQTMIGLGDEYMNAVYNAMDVHLLVSMGEGFGLPIVEAQAAGCPVIVGDWTAMPELCFSGWKVAKAEAEPTFTPMNAWQYTPHFEAIAERLEAAFRMKDNPDYRKRARDGALKYDADKVTEKYWRPALDDMWKRIEAWQPEDQKKRQWIKVGLFNPDGSMDVPDKTTGDALRSWKDGRQQVVPGGFKNPLGLKLVDPDGLEWILMREVERDYAIGELQLDRDSTVIDIGAHVGIVSMSLAKMYGCQVFAYEPDPENFRRLRANVEANELSGLIEARMLAVTRDARQVRVEQDQSNSGGSHIVDTDGRGPETGSVTLQYVIDMASVKIDLLKIDCEGAEYEILEGTDLSDVKAIRGEFHGPKGPELLEKVKAQVPDTKVTLQGVAG
jgi:FkbM family methyltransferase